MIFIFILSCLLASCDCQENPPSLADDTRVNTLLSLNAKHGGFRRLDPSSELVREHPPGSGSLSSAKNMANPINAGENQIKTSRKSSPPYCNTSDGNKFHKTSYYETCTSDDETCTSHDETCTETHHITVLDTISALKNRVSGYSVNSVYEPRKQIIKVRHFNLIYKICN